MAGPSLALSPAPVLVLALAAGCGGETAPDGYPPPGEPQSLVVFLVDTLRADHLGCYGYERDTSPRLDALAASGGIVFEHCLAQSTWTKPTTASIHTGMLPSRHGANEGASVLQPDLQTLAERLGAAGYRTAGFGFNPHVFGSATGFEQGFDVYEEVRGDPEAADDPDPFLVGPRAAAVVDRALDWLDELAADRDGAGSPPFLLYLHLIDVHMPYRPPEPFASRFRREPQPETVDPWALNGGADELGKLSALQDLYDGEIAYVDSQLGRLYDGLAAHGLDASTAVLFVSDHGEEFLEHGRIGHGDAQIYDEIVHVPLVLLAPNLPEDWRGARVPHLVQQVDVLPTALDLAGVDPDPELDGRSVLDRLRAPREAVLTVGMVEAQSADDYRKAVVHDGRKYARTWRPAKREELYDLRGDPGEQRDLLEGDPEAADRHRVLLDEHLRGSPGRYRVVIESTGDAPQTVVGYLSTVGVKIQSGSLVGCETGVDGPYEIVEHEQDGESAYAVKFQLVLSPGDRDELVFHPHPFSTSVDVGFSVDEAEGDPARVGIGETGAAPDAMPFALDLEDPEALWSSKAVFAPGAPGGAGSSASYRVAIFRMMDEVAPVGELSERDRAALRALGYADE